MSASVLPLTTETPADSEPLAGSSFVCVYPPLAGWQSAQAPALEQALKQPAPPALISLYLHLPFCQKKCDGCHHLSHEGQPPEVIRQHLDAPIREWTLHSRRPAVRGRSVSFAHFGGDTPSTLTTSQVRSLGIGLRSALAWDIVDEVTFECAPRSVRRDFLETLHEPGVSRLSPGVQGFDHALPALNAASTRPKTCSARHN